MSEKQETVNPVISKDYCIMKLKVVDREITEISINKVRNNYPATLYFTNIKSSIEDIDKTILRVLDIIGTDIIFYINNETEIQLFKSKCESMQLSISNELLNGNNVLNDMATNQKSFVCNVLELIIK